MGSNPISCSPRRLLLAGRERRGVGEVAETRQVRQVGSGSFPFPTRGNGSSACVGHFITVQPAQKKTLEKKRELIDACE